MQVLRSDPERIDQTFEVMIAVDGGQMEAWFQRFLAEPGGKELLAERPSLLARLADRESLRRLPPDTLGRAYVAQMEAWAHVADGLAKASAMVPALAEIFDGPERRWFLDRNGYIHDLLHTLTGYGQDWAGETSLLVFDHGVAPMRARLLGIVGALMTAPLGPGLFVHRYMVRAWQRGKKARIPDAYRWEEALSRPIADVRRELNIDPPHVAHPEGILAGGQKFGPWRFVTP